MNSRKSFFKKLGLILSGSFFGNTRIISGRNETDKEQSEERESILIEGSIKKEYDLVVVGGGISGCSAAISAARNGLKVALVHNRSMFGGSSSSEVKLEPEPNHRFNPWIKEGGIHEEFHLEERTRNHDTFTGNTLNANWDLVLYEWIYKEKNIDPYLNTHMHRAVMADDSTIESIFCVQLGTNKDYLFCAPLFVDSTGDGNLGYFSGADYRWGRESKDEYGESLAPSEPDKYHLGNTFYFNARDTGRPVPFKRPDWAAEFKTEDDLFHRGHHHQSSEDVFGGYWWLEIASPYHWIKDMNEGRHEAMRQLLGVWDHIKNKGENGAENYGLEFVGTWPYKRDSYRILGDYILTQHDVQNPQEHEDSVAYGAWYIDLHNKGGILARDKVPAWEYHHTVGTNVYGIPLRALYSRNIDNLMMAGRMISCSYLAFASARVLSTGSIIGQAVGIAAALAKKYNATPQKIAREHAKECQQIILRQDGHIPGVINEDPHDLARKAIVSASGSSPMIFPDAEEERELVVPHAQLFPVSEKRINKVKLLMRSERNQPVKIRLGLRSAPSVWDFRSEDDLAISYATIPANFEGWVQFDFNTSVLPDKLYYIYTDKHDKIFWKSFSNPDEGLSQTPIGTTAAIQPEKPPYSDHPSSFKEIYPPTTIDDLPGAGRNGFWEPLVYGESLALKVDPVVHPYKAQNVNSGTNRPDQWTNVWISDPKSTLPAWLKLEWDTPITFNSVQLTFDTNQNYRVIEPLYKYPECIKDYILEYKKGSEWIELASEEDNYMRRRVHNFEKIRANALRIQILETNGAPNARIYEIRVYNEIKEE